MAAEGDIVTNISTVWNWGRINYKIKIAVYLNYQM